MCSTSPEQTTDLIRAMGNVSRHYMRYIFGRPEVAALSRCYTELMRQNRPITGHPNLVIPMISEDELFNQRIKKEKRLVVEDVDRYRAGDDFPRMLKGHCPCCHGAVGVASTLTRCVLLAAGSHTKWARWAECQIRIENPFFIPGRRRVAHLCLRSMTTKLTKKERKTIFSLGDADVVDVKDVLFRGDVPRWIRDNGRSQRVLFVLA